MSADIWLHRALEVVNLNSDSGQLNVPAVPEVLILVLILVCVEAGTCQMLLTLLSHLTSFPIPSFIPVTVIKCVLRGSVAQTSF